MKSAMSIFSLNCLLTKLCMSCFVSLLTFNCSPADGMDNGHATVQLTKLK